MMLAQVAGGAMMLAIIPMHDLALAPFTLEPVAFVLPMLALEAIVFSEVLAPLDAFAPLMTVAIVIMILGESGGRAAKRKC